MILFVVAIVCALLFPFVDGNGYVIPLLGTPLFLLFGTIYAAWSWRIEQTKTAAGILFLLQLGLLGTLIWIFYLFVVGFGDMLN